MNIFSLFLITSTFVSPFGLLSSAAQAQTLDSEESAFLALLNNYRVANGAGPLAISPALSNSSRWMSNDMASKNYFSHTDSLGRDPGTRLASFGYPYSWGENLAAGNAAAQNTLNQFINACDADASGACTYAHRVNMLNPGWKVIGIARAAGGTYGWYWTNDFGAVADQPQTSAPAISTFTAVPSVIAAGASSTLSWIVSGATSVSVDNGVGSVSGAGLQTVSPSSTTIYRLTATNASGSAAASVTVTVNPAAPAGDAQPPTSPVITSAAAAGPTEVDLTWTGSSDNVAVSGYQILRNGNAVASVSTGVRSWADNAAMASSTFAYTIKAFDAALNYSLPSNVITVTTPAAPVTPGPPTTGPGGSSVWTDLGGSITGRISVISNSNGTLQAFARGTDNALWTVAQTSPNGVWARWQRVGGVLASDPAAAKNGNGLLEVFVLGSDNSLWEASQSAPNGPLTNWQGLGQTLTSDPAVAVNADGRVQVFAAGRDRALWTISETAPGGTWSGWTSLGGTMMKNPAAITNTNGTVEAFVIGTDNTVWHIAQTSPAGAWSPWGGLGGSIAGSPAALLNSSSGLAEVFGLGTDGAIWNISRPSGSGWSGWTSLGGFMTSDPTAAFDTNGITEIFARGGGNGLWRITDIASGPPTGWKNWLLLSGTLANGPAAAVNQDGRLAVFVEGSDAAIWTIEQSSSGLWGQ